MNKLTTIVWSTFYKVPDMLREGAVLTFIVVFAMFKPSMTVLLATTWLFVLLAMWSCYYKSRR